MMVEFGDLDPETGELRLVDAINRLQRALDVEPVKKSFYEDFRQLHDMLMEAIVGVPEVRDRRWYASALLNRLMFVYFLQRRSFLDRKPGQTSGDYDYLRTHFTRSKAEGADRYFEHFLLPLFFEGFAKPEQERDPDIAARIGHIRYLNGGMFLPHAVEQRYEASLQIPDAAFNQILTLFDSYNWALDDSPTGNEKEINPAVLGFILEKYINQKEFGAY